MIRVAERALIVAVSIASTLAGTAVAQPVCTGDPARTLLTVPGPQPCRQFSGDQATCDLAFYATFDGDPISCAYIEGTCVGCGGENLICPTNTCTGTSNPVSTVVCDGDPGRTALLGQGSNGSERCRSLDHTDQATCENAFYDDDTRPVACFWESTSGACIGCGGDNEPRCPFNACRFEPEVADAVCEQDAGRTNLLGFGGNDHHTCRQLDGTDETTCENAYYEDESTGVPVACWWDGDECRGSGFDRHFGWNECLSSVAPPPATATCPEDPGRSTLLGFGHNRSHACRQLDHTDPATCEDAYYEDDETGQGVACWWDGDECRGSLDDFRLENACQHGVLQTPTAVCAEPRSNLLGFGGGDYEVRACRALDGTDQATCENAYYEYFDNGIAVACVWNGSECRGCAGRNSDCTDNPCVTPTCEGEPRPTFLGFGSTSTGLGQSGGACRQFDGDQNACEDAWYFSRRKGRGVGCWWDGGDCRGSTRRPSEDACRTTDAECTRQPGRSNFLGFGDNGNSPCRNLDGTDKTTCEGAYYEAERTGTPVACYWAAGDHCFGSFEEHLNQNACVRVPEVADATCEGRGTLVGFGHDESGENGGACRSLDGTDVSTCEDAFYQDVESGAGVACWWDGSDCNGSLDDYSSENACLQVTTTCTLDPSRPNLLGRGEGQEFCRALDGTDVATCEAAYYVSDNGPIPVACWWDGDQCRGTSRQFFFANECIYDEPPVVADATCEATPEPTMLLGFGNFRLRQGPSRGSRPCRLLDLTDQATCENAYYESIESGLAVSCWWDGVNCRGSARNNSQHNVCSPDLACTREPDRSNNLGFGNNNSSPCRQLDGTDPAMCEDAYYIGADSHEPSACWWSSDAQECRGSSEAFARVNACLRTPLPPTATCSPRTNLLGFGNNGSEPCPQLNGTDETTCENAYYEDAQEYRGVACEWNPQLFGGACLGTRRWEPLNVCDTRPEDPPACPRDPSRVVFAGRGRAFSSLRIGDNGGACRQFDYTDSGTCESAYYLGADEMPTACHWDASFMLCVGTGPNGSPEQRAADTCLTGGFACADERSTVLGAGSNGREPCRQFDGTDQATCEDTFYIDPYREIPVSCFWDSVSGDCNGCGRNRDRDSACTVNACVDVSCEGDPGRTAALRCSNLSTQAQCEDTWHVAVSPFGHVPFAAACVWSSEDNDCYGCGTFSQALHECVNSCAVGCGNGVMDPGETCDDGNTFDGDCCDSSCQLVSDGTPCTDGLFCTEGAGMCQAGQCVGTMPRLCASCVANDCSEFFNECVGDGFRNGPPDAVGAAQLQGVLLNMSMPEPEGTFCDDGLASTSASQCDGMGLCVEQVVGPTPTPTPEVAVPAAPAPAMTPWGLILLIAALLGLALRTIPAIRARRQ